MHSAVERDHARAAYDAAAGDYDAFTAHHDYDQWTTTLERLAHQFGLRGHRLLDVACGTGKSFMPFLDRGYVVTACDVSESMVRLAAQKVGDTACLAVHDMRSLPMLGSFDLVCCLDDAINYLLSTEELRNTFFGLRQNLADDGLVVFDVNSLCSFRTFFATMTVMPSAQRVLIWDGHASPSFRAGDCARCTLEILNRQPDGTWNRRLSVHHQRHHPRRTVEQALTSAGLECIGVHGMQLDGSVSESFRESRNSKAVYIARHSAPRRQGR